MMGAGDRVRVREGRHRGRAQGRLAGGRRARQGLLARSSSPRRVERGKVDPGEGRRAAGADHRRPTDPAAADGADLVIEAVFEDPEVKAQVFAEIEPHLRRRRAAGLEHLDAADHRARRGRRRARPTSSGCTSSARWTRCRCWRSSRASRPPTRRCTARSTSPSRSSKTPIVVNDSRGFFTSRVIGTFINEGIAMLAEGVPAPTIEQASSQAGYPAPGAAALRRAQPEADAQDPRRRRGGGRGRGRRLGRRTRPTRSSTGCSTSSTGPASSRARASTSTRTASAPACGRACARRSRRSTTRRTISLRDLEEIQCNNCRKRKNGRMECQPHCTAV